MTKEEERLRGGIIGAINALGAPDWDSVKAQFPSGGDHTERMIDRLLDHLRTLVGKKPLTRPGKAGTYIAAIDEQMDRLLAETEFVRETWNDPPMKTFKPGKKKRRR